jgi:hypothetical protein
VPFRSSYSPTTLPLSSANKVFSVQDLVQAINTSMKMYECMYIGWWTKTPLQLCSCKAFLKHSCQVVWKFEVPCSITAFQGNMIIRALCNCESVLFVSAVDFSARALEPTNWRPLMETTREVNCICQRDKSKQKLLSWILLAHKRKAKKPLLFHCIFPCSLMNKENWCAVYWDDRLWQ